MTLPARGAAIRGDEYQHVIGLYHAMRVLTEPDLESISIEDADGGAFDDIVVRAVSSSPRPHEYMQAKSGVHREAVIAGDWLTTSRTPGGRSPLQHFHHTWTELCAMGDPFLLRLLTNKNFDHNDPLLQLIDNKTDKITRAALDKLTPRTNGGKQLTAWSAHLKVTSDELATFLSSVEFVHTESEQSWADRTAALMRTAGLRDDAEAVTLAQSMVREWVTLGAGRRTTNDVRSEVARRGLLARDGELVLAIQAIDRINSPHRPNAELDFVDLYPDVDPFQRRALRNPDDWSTVLLDLESARRDLEGFRNRHLHVVAKMRLPMYFAVGRTFPDVAGWVLSTNQRNTLWSSSAAEEAAVVDTRFAADFDRGVDLAVAVGLANDDPTEDVDHYLKTSQLPIGRLITLSAPGAPSRTCVSGPGWAVQWVRLARSRIREEGRALRSRHIHLFLSSPAAVALFLGHDWNLLPTTTVYDYLGFNGYTPTMIFPG